MKNLIILGILFISYISIGQNFDEDLPINYKKITETKGDLDNDGVEEIVYVYNTDKKTKDLGFETNQYFGVVKKEGYFGII